MPTDEEIFNRICTMFNGLEYALAKHDFHYGIRAEVFDEIYEYVGSDDPMKEFVDERLEVERKKLINATVDFLRIFGMHVTLDGEYFYTSLRFQQGQKMSEGHRKKLEGEIDTLNRKASELWAVYKNFVRKVRRLSVHKSSEGGDVIAYE